MSVDPDNAEELATIAGEVGAEVLRGVLRYPSDTGGWQLGDLDLDEYLALFRDQRLVLIIAPVRELEQMTFTCGVCGFVMEMAGECPRCGLQIEEAAPETEYTSEERDVIDQVADLLDGGEDGSD